MIEAGILFACFYIGYFARYADLEFLAVELRAHLSSALTYVLVMMASFVALGLYERAAVGDMGVVTIRLLAAFLGGFVLLAVTFYLLPGLKIWRSGLVIAMPASFVAVLFVRRLFLWLVDRDALSRRLLVLGDPGPIADLRACERRIGLAPFRVVRAITLDTAPDRANDDSWLLEACRAAGAEEIVVAASDRRGRLPMRALLCCRLAGVPVYEYHDFYERWTGRIDLERLQPGWLIFNDGFGRGKVDAVAKRLFDVVLASLGLIVSAPLLLLAGLAIKLEDGGPILFRQERVGRNGIPFEILKLRSMRLDAERDGPRWAAVGDRRVTRVGRILRRTRIDELPQLVNVLKGEMSFVGPRPERPVFVQRIIEVLPYFAVRHQLRPGLAGWAQLNHPYAAGLEDTRVKLEYDLYYIKNRSLFLDILIIAQTLRVIVWGNGAR
ncbi:MAG: TIGR03013 family PEP-CTERM/XrtA system glycosyltransferase [Geminicoccaceae bacterium]|nr:TIGR03013 family PEP-CTERM/XrtA system glycosyltransferase [Geminicoccaceae bacterium]